MPTYTNEVTEVQARQGAKGSFSYSDTSVYGPSSTMWGGGARVNKILKYGSRTTGYNPNGLVVVRIFKVG